MYQQHGSSQSKWWGKYIPWKFTHTFGMHKQSSKGNWDIRTSLMASEATATAISGNIRDILPSCTYEKRHIISMIQISILFLVSTSVNWFLVLWQALTGNPVWISCQDFLWQALTGNPVWISCLDFLWQEILSGFSLTGNPVREKKRGYIKLACINMYDKTHLILNVETMHNTSWVQV